MYEIIGAVSAGMVAILAILAKIGLRFDGSSKESQDIITHLRAEKESAINQRDSLRDRLEAAMDEIVVMRAQLDKLEREVARLNNNAFILNELNQRLVKLLGIRRETTDSRRFEFDDDVLL